MITALYSRTSTDRQRGGLESQERALLEYCSTHKISNYKMFSDFNVSGTKSSRPQLDLMMNEIEKGSIDKVVVYSFSRFARSTKHLVTALDFFKSKKVQFVSISEQLDTSSSYGTALFSILSAIAQLERDILSERVKLGLRNAEAKGKKIGRPKTRPGQSIISLHKEKYSYREIAKLLGISHTAVGREVKIFKCKQSEDEKNLITGE